MKTPKLSATELTSFIGSNTDKYFTYTKKIVKANLAATVIYAFFLRSPCIYACKIALDWLKQTAETLDINVKIIENYQEGALVGAGEPLFFIEGDFSALTELETILLQKIGLCCICGWNAFQMSLSLPKVGFISMLARHMAGEEMVKLCDYGISVGSASAKNKGAKGFIGGSTDNSASYFGNEIGLGTMPHALIGYANSTLEAAKLYHKHINNKTITVLVDYFGKEVSDALEVCNYFKELADTGNLSVRLDTHGGRFLEGLNNHKSYEIIEEYFPEALYQYQDQKDLNALVGMGVSAASIFYMRQALDNNGFKAVKIVVSSGFNLHKCQLMAKVKAPIDIIGTGSTLPTILSNSYATADIISYNGQFSVKVGREFLITKYKQLKKLK